MSGINYPLYFFEKDLEGHYDESGKYCKNFNEDLINGARLSSPFGMRKHPIDGLIKCIEVQILLLR